MSLFKSASTVSLLTLVSRVTGLARELLMAAAFGASALTDAFNVAFRIPNLFRRLFAEGAFSQAFVPVLATVKEREGEQAARQLIDRAATVLAWVLLLVSIVGVLAAPALVWLLASGLRESAAHAAAGGAAANAYEAAVLMTRWMFPYIAFMSLVALGAGVLNTWRRFAVPAATPVLLNVAMILAALFAAHWGAPWLQAQGIEPIYTLAVGVLVGGVLQLGAQAWALKRMQLLPRIGLSPRALRAAWTDAGTRRVLTLMAPALLGVGVAQLSLLINTQIASYLAPGSVSWLSYADRLMEFPVALLGVALGVVLMPQLAAAKSMSDAAEGAARYSELLDWGLRLVVLLALPCALALSLFAQPLTAVLYHYGAFTARDVQMTAAALMGWGAGLLGVVAVKVLAPAYYASQDMRTPVRIAIVVLVLTQLLNLVLVPVLQHAALSLSIGIGALLNALWLLLGLRGRGSYRPLPGWSAFMARVLLACALLAAYLHWAAGAWDWTGLQAQPWLRMGLLAAIVAGAGLIYLGVAWMAGLRLRALLRR
ncbi:membrane protein [Hylemonella gracilis str. Niagara R]|uniref:Probable lipid II flippase MurJ n=1 Tax=Hylemonella gracilis str. Niagara R TaxID=1458275 RepID=A0A016XHV1_9BURK|nr:murein biosynthesis integral membrane protein MurJ [Hylemonella gracilis]EYC51117.1 membrane protein [Hylemonella gracilis str. Niagara R]